MSKRWLVLVETDDVMTIEAVKGALDEMGLSPIRLEPHVPALGMSSKVVMQRREPNGRTTHGERRTDFVLCDSCYTGDCERCAYPFDCPCTSPMHNGAPFERMQVEALNV